MKFFYRVMMLVAIAATVANYGCKQREINDLSQPSVAVTYSLIDGAWQMVEWQGKPLAEGLYLYVEFDRTEQHFEMWENIGSMYARNTTGSFRIEQDEYDRYILCGTYDYGVGDWNDEYEVTATSENEMIWRSTTTQEVSIYHRIEAIPEL